MKFCDVDGVPCCNQLSASAISIKMCQLHWQHQAGMDSLAACSMWWCQGVAKHSAIVSDGALVLNGPSAVGQAGLQQTGL